MQVNRPVVMSVAGLDPCGGAGLLADIKAFEQHKVYGLGVATAQTIQTEDAFYSIRWESDENILEAMEKMFSNYEVSAVKLGIVQSLKALDKIVSCIHTCDQRIKIVLDPVIRSTTDFNFWANGVDEGLLCRVLKKIELITPNYREVVQLAPDADPNKAAMKLSAYCHVLLKGGHNEEEPGVDYLITDNNIIKLYPGAVTKFAKHGSGCVLSSAIAANMALNSDLITACRKAKSFTEKFLLSNPTLLGYHVS